MSKSSAPPSRRRGVEPSSPHVISGEKPSRPGVKLGVSRRLIPPLTPLDAAWDAMDAAAAAVTAAMTAGSGPEVWDSGRRVFLATTALGGPMARSEISASDRATPPLK